MIRSPHPAGGASASIWKTDHGAGGHHQDDGARTRDGRDQILQAMGRGQMRGQIAGRGDEFIRDRTGPVEDRDGITLFSAMFSASAAPIVPKPINP